jgi:GntR family transcriptional regulator
MLSVLTGSEWLTVEVAVNSEQPVGHHVFVDSPGYRRIADDLAAKIRRGDLGPGDLLPSITELAKTPGSSASKARDALEWLKAQGWAETAQGRRYVVTAVPPMPEEPETWLARQAALEERVAALEAWQAEVERQMKTGPTD